MNENNNEEKTGTGNNKDLNIFQDTLKNIIKIFQIFCNSSVEISNLILNMNILEIILGNPPYLIMFVVNRGLISSK